MFQYSASRDIAAPPENVWAILSDARQLETGFGIRRIEGTLSGGATIKVWSEVSPERAFPVRVTTFSPPHCMVWTGGMPLGLFRGVRSFTVTPLPGTGSRFVMEEVFSGILAGLIGRAMPDLQPSFETFASALKRIAEQ